MPVNIVVADYPPFLESLAQVGPAGYDWSGTIRAATLALGKDANAGDPTQDTTMRILAFDATKGRPGLKVFYKVEDTTITLLRARPHQEGKD